MKTTYFVLLFCILGFSPVYPQIDHYPYYPEYVDMLYKFQEDYPQICKIEEFGTSVRGRKLLAAKISDNAAEDEKEPAVFFQSTIHGEELGGYILALNLIEHLLSKYGNDNLISKLVDSVEIWVNPLANPDGTYMAGDSSVAGAVRYNANRVDLDRDFPLPTLSASKTAAGQLQPETKAIIEFCDTHPFVLGADFHCGAEFFGYVWGHFQKMHPDNQWWDFVSREWAEEAQALSPTDYFTSFGGWGNLYALHGAITPMTIRADYAMFYQQCRDAKVEVSIEKQPNQNQLIEIWKYQKESIINYINQALFGVRGTVTDAINGEPLKAKVFIERHDKDSSWVFSHLPHGDYYRPIFEGNYDITFIAPHYHPRTYNVSVQKNRTTVLDVELHNDMGIKISGMESVSDISIYVGKKDIRIHLNNSISSYGNITIFDISGRLIRSLQSGKAAGKRIIVWDGCDRKGRIVPEGCYIFCMEHKGEVYTKQFVISR